MRRGMLILTLLVSHFMVGCAALSEHLYGGQQATHNDVKIYAGQSADSVEKALGSPNVISSGRFFCKNSTNLPFGISPGENTVEWVYIGPTQSTLVYLDEGRVSYVYQIPTNKVRR